MTTTNTFAHHIKNSTALAHARTEKAMMLEIKSMKTAADYAKLLNCLYGYFHPVEQKINSFAPGIISDYDRRRRSSSIVKDLASMGYLPPANYTFDTPAICNFSQAIGCLYVLEGSILGGAIIKRRIQSQCPGISESAYTYFTGYDGQTPEMWQSFILQFNEYFNDHPGIETAVASANDCFEKLEHWINIFYNNQVMNNLK